MYTRPKNILQCAIHAWHGRTASKLSLEHILKEHIAHLTRVTTLLKHVLGMSDIVILPQADQSLVCKEHVCSNLGPFRRRIPTDEVRFWCWTHIWWVWDIKFYGLLHSGRNDLCIWRNGCGKTPPWKWQRVDIKMGQRTFKVLQSARLDRQEAECKGSFCQRTTESFMLHFIFYRRGDSTLNHSFNNIVQFAPRGAVFCWSPV